MSYKNTMELILSKYNEDAIYDSWTLILKLLNNIVKTPGDDKFRLFKKTNEAIKKKVLMISENLKLIKDIGYVDLDDELLAFQGDDLTNIKNAISDIGHQLEILTKKKAEKQYEEELKRQEQLRKNNEELMKKFKEEKEKQKKIQEQLEFDKRERALREKPKDSVGRNLEFGAKVCKFEPKNNQRG